MNGEVEILSSYACKDCMFYGSCNIENKPHLCPLDDDVIPHLHICDSYCAEQ